MWVEQYRAHPWHGVEAGPKVPERVTAYIELVPTDTVKYEIDKTTGLLKVDRPQRYSNVCPALYGFIPRTHCGELSGLYCSEKAGRTGLIGDGDPLDICVLTEKSIPRGDILIEAIPIGGLRMIDRDEADDKIIAVMANDAIYGDLHEMEDLNAALVDRLRHYFLTYKNVPGAEKLDVEITHIYGREEAFEVILNGVKDYAKRFVSGG